MVKVVIVNGFPGSGKTTFQRECEMLRYDIGDGFCISVSTVDFVKRVAHCAGWDMTKTPENRKFLSDLMIFSFAFTSQNCCKKRLSFSKSKRISLIL